MFPVAKGCDAVLLDLHGATVIAGYQTYPHVDMYETGIRAARPILNSSRSTMAFGRRPMLPHVMRQSSLDSPNKEIQARAKDMERQGALCASLFVGFPHADIPYAGSSAVVVTDGDAAKARALCDELLELAWQAPDKFVYQVEPHDIAAFRVLGIDPASKRYVMLKSRVRRPLYPLDPETRFCSGN